MKRNTASHGRSIEIGMPSKKEIDAMMMASQ